MVVLPRCVDGSIVGKPGVMFTERYRYDASNVALVDTKSGVGLMPQPAALKASLPDSVTVPAARSILGHTTSPATQTRPVR